MTVVDNYFPFDTGSGSNATPARWRLMARQWRGSGVIYGYLNALSCSIFGSVVTIQTGAAWIDGYYGENDAPKTVGVTGNGQVVARMDPTARQILFIFVPNQTVPTQNQNGIFEVPLVQVTGTTIKDIRQFAGPSPTGPVRCRVCRVAAYTTTTAIVAFGWDTTTFGSGWSGTTYTCPINADYVVMAQIGFASSAVGQWANLRLYHNGVGYSWTGTNGAQGPNQAIMAQLHDMVPCAAGDTLVLYHNYSTAGLAGYVGAGNSFADVRALP